VAEKATISKLRGLRYFQSVDMNSTYRSYEM